MTGKHRSSARLLIHAGPRLTTQRGSTLTWSAGNRASPREASRATNSAITPSSATISSDWMTPGSGRSRNRGGSSELSCATIRVGLHA